MIWGLWCALWLSAQTTLPEGVVLGEVAPRVACAASPEQTYALYLPTNYDPGQKWPLLLCLDPVRRGALPVSRFASAAERWGYIVIGSNNSQNYDWSSTTQAVNALMKDGLSRYSIDTRRIYHAGFSGGARASCDLALMARKAAGVISFGAAFNRGRQPTSFYRFDFVGVIGEADMNYRELMGLDITLDELGWNHRIITFLGGHQWPTEPAFERALAWMELQAYRRGWKKDDQALQQLYQWGMDEAARLEQTGEYHNAWLTYKYLVEDFEKLVATKEAKAQALRLGGLKEVHRTVKKKEAIAKRERLLQRTYHGRIDDLRYMELVEKDMEKERSWWRKKMKDWHKQPEEREERLFFSRMRETMTNGIWEVAMVALAKNEPERAVFSGEIAAMIAPKAIGVQLTLARAYSLTGRLEEALTSVQAAHKNGMVQLTRLDHDPKLVDLRKTAAYQDWRKEVEKH